MSKKIIVIIILIPTLLLAYYLQDNNENIQKNPTDSDTDGTFDLASSEEAEIGKVEQVADGLMIPWEVVFLPDQSMLITERPGQLTRIEPDGKTEIEVNGVAHIGEGGLLGLALHPEYEMNNFIYLYYTSGSVGSLENKVVRFVFKENENSLDDELLILEGIPGNSVHNGGRIAFGPDGFLYITTGDAGNGQESQDVRSLAGKILRIADDGSIPEDNPFGNEVYSYGHRNPQGLTWDKQDRLWASEHGPSGAGSGYDEINLIEKGGNYGWPEVFGDETGTDMIPPIVQSGSDDTWAPGDLEIINDQLYFTGLRGQAIYRTDISGSQLGNFRTIFKNEFGRLRIIKEYNNWIYFSTSNTDGRGNPSSGDDKIMRVRL